MIQIVFADDDFMVRSYLSQLVDWEQNGYRLAGIAKDGVQALQMIEQIHPEIVITDIEMPMMNGIDLLRKLKQEQNSAKVIMLSCHDDFEYVKEAMRIGADEYLLKDEITAEKLLHTLREVAPQAERKEKTEVIQESERKMLLRLLDGMALRCSCIKPNAVFAVRVMDYEERIAFQPAERREQFYNAFAHTCVHVGRKLNCIRAVHVRGGLFAILCEVPKKSSRQEQLYILQENAAAFASEFERIYEFPVLIGVSGLADEQADIADCWNQAQEAMGHSFYHSGNIFYAWQYPAVWNRLPASAERFLEQADEMAAHKSSSEMKRLLDTVLTEFSDQQTPRDLVANWVRSADRLLGVDIRQAPKRFADVQEMVGVYLTVSEEMLPDTDQYSEGVAAAIRYIQEHYRENISLSDAADSVHLASTYLSYVFHKETEITFSEYLQSCRINHAKELLERTGTRIREVGELAGYHDNRHFSKIFKKATGMTPQEYRKIKQR